MGNEKKNFKKLFANLIRIGQKTSKTIIGERIISFFEIRVFVCGMNYWTSMGDLNKLFEKYGAKNFDFSIEKSNGISNGSATIDLFESVLANEIIRTFSRDLLNGKQIFLCVSNETSISDMVLNEPIKGITSIFAILEIENKFIFY